jgi:HD-like signal output (HDOD) protein
MSAFQQDSHPSEIDNLVERSIIDLGIPPCPAILNRFTVEMSKDEPDYNRLASIIVADVGISAGLIKTANSPYFGLRERVRSGGEALVMLGLKATSHAIAGIILRKSFPDVSNLERFWDASARISGLSGWLAHRLDIPGLYAEDAYTFGLFRDCGIPVLLGRFKNYQAVLDLANRETKRSFVEVEEVEMPTNHAMVGCILAQSWWLPEEICLAIRNHHDAEAFGSASSRLPMLSRRLIATSQLAEHIVQHLLGLSLTQEWEKLGVVCLQLLGMKENQLEVLYTDAEPIVTSAE